MHMQLGVVTLNYVANVANDVATGMTLHESLNMFITLAFDYDI